MAHYGVVPVADKSILRSIPLFELFDDDELATLASLLDEERYIAGEHVFKSGDAGGKLYIIQSGRVELFVHDRAGDRVSLSVIGDGDMFGELSLLDNQPRSATAKALDETLLIAVGRDDLRLLVSRYPAAALHMMAALGKRIREANALLRERIVRNVNEELVPDKVTFNGLVVDLVTRVAGNIKWVYFTLVCFTLWIVWNSKATPFLPKFDNEVFGFLATIATLEAIFLSHFVLISQNRQALRDKIRNDIEYEVNVRAELEVRHLSRQLEELQALIAQHFGTIHARHQELERRIVTSQD